MVLTGEKQEDQACLTCKQDLELKYCLLLLFWIQDRAPLLQHYPQPITVKCKSHHNLLIFIHLSE